MLPQGCQHCVPRPTPVWSTTTATPTATLIWKHLSQHSCSHCARLSLFLFHSAPQSSRCVDKITGDVIGKQLAVTPHQAAKTQHGSCVLQEQRLRAHPANHQCFLTTLDSLFHSDGAPCCAWSRLVPLSLMSNRRKTARAFWISPESGKVRNSLHQLCSMLTVNIPPLNPSLCSPNNDENTLALGQSLAYTLASTANGAVFISWNGIQNLKRTPYFLPKKQHLRTRYSIFTRPC